MSPAFAASAASPAPPRWEPIPQSAKTKITKTAMTAQRIHWRCLKFSRSALSILVLRNRTRPGRTPATGPERIVNDTPEANGGKVGVDRPYRQGMPDVRHDIRRFAVRVSRNERYAQEVPERPGIPARVVLRLDPDTRSDRDRHRRP